MDTYGKDTYPAEPDFKHENSDNEKGASWLDLQLEILNSEMATFLYDNLPISKLGITSNFQPYN